MSAEPGRGLYQSGDGRTWNVRRAVPAELRGRHGLGRYVKRSLGTKDARVAEKRARDFWRETDAKFADARLAGDGALVTAAQVLVAIEVWMRDRCAAAAGLLEEAPISLPGKGSAAAGLAGEKINLVKRRGFTTDGLELVFEPLRPLREAGAARFWLPSLALYSGARSNELAPIRTGDVKLFEGLPFIDLTPFDESGRRTDDKRLKNDASGRTGPLHPEIIRAGLLEHVTKRREQKSERLFPKVEMGPNGRYSHDCVEKAGWRPSNWPRLSGADGRPLSGRHGALCQRDKLGELAEVLGGGGEEELVTGSVRSS